MKILKRIGTIAAIIGLFIICVFLYLNRPLPQEIKPAEFTCLSPEQGAFQADKVAISRIYGIGLAYANHINETASKFDPSGRPPVFTKSLSSLMVGGGLVSIPEETSLIEKLAALEPQIEAQLRRKDVQLNALLDYEVELAFVLLEDVSDEILDTSTYMPKVGFLVANDLSARSLAILGEDQANKYAYWGASKSFAGFTPISSRLWVPNISRPDAIPCVDLKTYVDGELRQLETTRNLIYTPKQMLKFISETYPERELKKGDMILTGTPGGVVMNVPRWKLRLATMIGLDRFQKLSINQAKANQARFLQPDNEVRVSAGWLGEVNVLIAPN